MLDSNQQHSFRIFIFGLAINCLDNLNLNLECPRHDPFNFFGGKNAHDYWTRNIPPTHPYTAGHMPSKEVQNPFHFTRLPLSCLDAQLNGLTLTISKQKGFAFFSWPRNAKKRSHVLYNCKGMCVYIYICTYITYIKSLRHSNMSQHVTTTNFEPHIPIPRRFPSPSCITAPKGSLFNTISVCKSSPVTRFPTVRSAGVCTPALSWRKSCTTRGTTSASITAWM